MEIAIWQPYDTIEIFDGVYVQAVFVAHKEAAFSEMAMYLVPNFAKIALALGQGTAMAEWKEINTRNEVCTT